MGTDGGRGTVGGGAPAGPVDLDAWVARSAEGGAADPDRLDDLDATATLARAERVLRLRRAAEVEDLELCLRWADLHASDPAGDPGANPVGGPRFGPPGGERLVDLGGPGTPMVRELALCELAAARETHVLSVRSVVADALDLRHRLPLTWAVTRSLECEPWLARKVASLTRVLDADVVGLVDRAVADAIGGHSPGRVLALAEAKVVEADPEGHAERVREERERRYVTLTRRDLTGLRGIVARVEEGDAEWFAATLERVADILAGRPEHAATPATDGSEAHPATSRDHLRAHALGWMARPADLLRLLLEHAGDAGDAGNAGAEQEVEWGPRDWAADEGAPAAPAHPERAWRPHPDLTAAETLAALDRVDLSPLRPRRTLYVHLGADALADRAVGGGPAAGTARAEGLGPVVLDHVGALLAAHGLAEVTVTGVVDLGDHIDTSAYEHTEAQKERIALLHTRDAFPHSSGRDARAAGEAGRLDNDHPGGWRPDGPPGQTSTRTSQPLGRTGHRAKTHLGWTCTPLVPGTTHWRSPHGLTRVVTATGTHRCGPVVGPAP